ncbi:MAG TPA: MFS transporter [Acidimicrobiales bacterium]
MGVKERGDQFRRLVRSAVDDLFDQRSPFGRLALTHVLMTAGDTMFAVSLAGSLFFSISPTAAKDKVLLYLLLTMGPFAVVAPALGPLIDRSRGARRAMVVTSALGRAVLCPFVARDIHSLLLFPEAFLMLVLSKVYLVTKGALVPEMAALEMPGTGVGPGPDGPEWLDGTGSGPPNPTPPYGMPPTVHVDDPVTGEDVVEPDLATLNARLGLLASLSGFVFALPAIAILKLAGAPAVLWSCAAVFVAGVVAGMRLPVRRLARAARDARRGRAFPSRREPTADVELAPDADGWWTEEQRDLAAFRPIAGTQVIMALTPMSVLKGLLGFLTFLFAFGLRREGAATWWFGLLIGALTLGAVIGVLLVGRLRRVLSEQQMLAASLWLVAAAGLLGWLFPHQALQALVAVAVGAAGAVAKPSFDALVQRHVRESDQGRAFARFETRLQLMWVIGSLVGVVLSLSIPAGNLVLAVVAMVGALSYMSALHSAADRA